MKSYGNGNVMIIYFESALFLLPAPFWQIQ